MSKQHEKKIQIRYRWWRPGKQDIKPEHVEAMEERADERIRKMMAQGYTSGELNDNIHMTDDDPEDGVEYTGWWEISTPNAEGQPRHEGASGSLQSA